ncbi:MAG: hypothetical protein IKV94_03710 [Clostridia bacterium]|nr:hypothetical protein [Clostridia bacterium]
MKKRVFCFLISLIVLILNKSLFAISSDFKFIIDELGIPQYNVKNNEINENIYNNYNEFVYGAPSLIIDSEQRWKSITSGKTIKNGEAGEYAILGYDYSGNFVYNYYFPLDRVSPIHLTQWNYLEVPGALESWRNASNKYSKEQIQYMKEAKWWFQEMENGANDPYNQIEYDINANKIGLNKVRLEGVATWKSKGSVYTLRRTESGGIGWAVFAVPPIAAEANVESYLEVDDEYVIEQEEDEVYIPIKFGGEVKNLSKYANISQIKEITTILLINDKEISRLSGSKIMSVGNQYMLVVSRENIPQNNQIKIKVHSYIKTDFLADGLLQGIEEKTITVKVLAKKPLTVEDKEIYMLYQNNNKWVVSPLAQKNKEDKYPNVGITEAGRYLIIKTKFNKEVKEKINKLKVYVDNNLINSSSYQLHESNSNSLVLSFQIPINTETTLYGIKSLREKYQNYFEILNSFILKRKKAPHELKIVFLFGNLRNEIEFAFDTIDDFISNMNTSVVEELKIKRKEHEISLLEFLES